MSVPALVAIACGCMLAVQPSASQPGPLRRLYVEPFATQAGAETLRDEVVAALRKVSSVSLVADESAADLVLGGGGEVWIKGYRSLNPRSDRLLSSGTPVYGGYLSVELKDRNGATLWSDLVTPEDPQGDLFKGLAKRIGSHLADELTHLEASPPRTAAPQNPAITLTGAGATFPYPVYLKWFANYHRENPGVQILYDSVGSEAGIRKLISGGVDFGASDSLEIFDELKIADQDKYILLPSVVGGVVPIVNLPEIPNEIKFTPEALAGIFLGKITKWNDPVLQRANRGIRLPELDIVVVHRADGSGTSFAWTDYLSRTSPAWRSQIGAGFEPRWPAGRAAAGNDGVAKLVKELAGAIGYVEFIYALQNHLSYGKVQNRNGEFVSASLGSLAAALSHSPEPQNMKASLANVAGPGVYPITSLTWLAVPAHIPDAARRKALTAFLGWMLGPGQQQAAALGYLSLPREFRARIKELIGQID